MLRKQSGQIDIFNQMLFEKLIPKDHLLVKIDELLRKANIFYVDK